MTDRAFILSWDTSLVGDEGCTASLVDFPGAANVAQWALTRPIEVPDPIYFEANPDTLAKVDYPDSDVRWPIMSARMRDIALRTAPAHRVIAVAMLDFYVPTDQRFADGKPRPGVAIDGFAAVQLLERTDAMDMARSRFTPDDDFPGRARSISQLVLRDVALPSLFRLSAYPSALLVSAETRAALDLAGIAGVTYLPLDRLV